ncbi:MAG: hypothetical protein ABL879_11575 [Devosia sp.]
MTKTSRLRRLLDWLTTRDSVPMIEPCLPEWADRPIYHPRCNA